MLTQQKINGAKQIISSALKNSSNPMVLTSFGKDSMVMLHLVRQVMPSIMCVFGKEPFCPAKYMFADKVVQEWGLNIYNLYHPFETFIQCVTLPSGEPEIEVVGKYSCKGGTYCTLPTGIVESDKPDCLCGLRDLYHKPRGYYEFPWDCAFVGQKNTDTDPFYEHLKIKQPINYQENIDFMSVFPLINFTDADIWEYSRVYKVPQNEQRYPYINGVKVTGVDLFRGQYIDLTYNPDYFECCTRCMNRLYPDNVTCPKTGNVIPNISHMLRYQEKPDLMPYMAEC